MWLWQTIESGFRLDIPSWRIEWFCFLLGIGLLIKTAGSIVWGDWALFSSNTFVRWQMVERFGAGATELYARLHRPFLLARLAAAIAIISGQSIRFAAAVSAIGLALELAWQFRHNTVFAFACSAAVGFAPPVSSPFTGSGTSQSGLTLTLIAIVTVTMYVNSAWLKFTTKGFRSGSVLRTALIGLVTLGPQMARWEFWVPNRKLADWLLSCPDWTWRCSALAVVVVELVLPALLVMGLVVPALVLGSVVHFCFFLLLPVRVGHYQLMTLASYLAFVPM